MRAGRIVEFGDTGDIVEHPTHPYTQRLLLASPVADPAQQRARRTQLRSLGRGESVAHG
jgi:peptide/nickel transport system ATP-binding protein